ncbi:MAG: Flp pilus assembly protein CpaB [Janthinobacterium lividum]
MTTLTKFIAAVLVLLAIVLGVIAVMVGKKASAPDTQQHLTNNPAPATHRIVLAGKQLVADAPINAASLKLVDLPEAPVDAFSEVSQVAGKVPRTTIDAGMPITPSNLANGIPTQLNKGERGVAVAVDEVIGVGNAIQPGDLVDVFFTLREAQGQDAVSRTQARLLLSRVKVLAYGNQILGATEVKPASNGAGASDNGRSQARTAVLAVPVQDVNALMLGAQAGKLTLALRQPTDDSVPDPTLFPAPAPVLRALPGLNMGRVAAISQPDNRAFSGVDLSGLAADARRLSTPQQARTTATPTVRRASTGGGSSIEIIRGTERQSSAY